MIYFAEIIFKTFLGCSVFLFGSMAGATHLNEENIGGYNVKNYKPVFRSCSLVNGSAVTQIREFQSHKPYHGIQDFALIVNEDSLESSVVDVETLLNCRESAAPRFSAEIQGQGSDYLHALLSLSFEDIDVLQNAGATHAHNNRQNVYLTIDLCPSHRALDLELFKKIQGGVRPVPVVVSISGLWLINHSVDLDSLLQMQSDNEIKITWANHSYSHPYDPKLPLLHNFVLKANISFKEEVFGNEILLLNNGIVPSIFFRFPGLVSNQEDVELLRQWGLIPLGANAWLALGGKPTAGSFILVHANGNEPNGLKLLYEAMAKNPKMKNEFSNIQEAFEP